MEPEPTNRDLMNSHQELATSQRVMMAALFDFKAAVVQGFAQVDARFDRVETRLTNIEGRVAGLERWTVHADKRFDQLEAQVSS